MANIQSDKTWRYSRNAGWMPFVVRKNDGLYLELGAGATANHDPRTFDIPITEDHLEVIKNDFVRHSLLWAAILPLCDAAGTRDPIDEVAVVALCDAILLGSEADVEGLFKEIKWYSAQLIAHHADVQLLAQGRLFAATQSLTPESDWNLAAEHAAQHARARRGVFLGILDAAVLKYTGQYLHGGGIPQRKPENVDPELLPQVLEIIATAERACAGMELSSDWCKKDWNHIKDRVEAALHNAYPTLEQDTVETVSFLMCSEASRRAREKA